MNTNDLTSAIIGAAIEVHRRLGPGLLESAYRVCLAYELRKRGLSVIEEKPIPVIYDEVRLECGFRADLIVDELVVVELKAKSAIHPVDKAQTLSHLRLTGLRTGLLINFHETKLVDGVSRIINGYEQDFETRRHGDHREKIMLVLRGLCASVFVAPLFPNE